MEIPVILSKVLINENSDQQIIVLSEETSQRSLSIMIGIPEVLAIDRNLKNQKTLRPLTHELLFNTINALGAKISKVIIHDFHQGVYFAHIELIRNGEILKIDSRPSDAIALSISAQTPIYVKEKVFKTN